jgi:3D (Asp-Asp-Asp) domain-containing protein
MTTQTDQPAETPDGITGRVGHLMKDGVRYLADLISRIVNGFKGIAQLVPIVAGLGCETASIDTAPMPAPTVSASVDAGTPTEAAPKRLGKFSITFYYVIGEEEVVAKKPVANDNLPASDDDASLATITTPPPPAANVTLYASAGCTPIAEVSREFALQLDIQGTGKLRDGRVLNVWGACPCDRSPCFKVTRAQWGTGGNGRALQPFRTVAVDPRVIKLGTLLYVPLLEGRRMPGRAPWGGFIHDGCVVADDVGGGIKDNQLDLFVGRKGWFYGMAASGSGGSHEWARNVPVFDGSQRCQRDGRQVSRRAGAI